MSLSPIALFVCNRLWHTKKTIEALKKNELARYSDLIVFSDGPKTPKVEKAVFGIRKHIKTVVGFKSVTLVERNHNYGLANSIINGVTMCCDKYGRVIVLEDDLITTPYFLTYMNTALERYEKQKRVMHISGYLLPVPNIERITESFFIRVTSSWGWATWKRAWNYFEHDAAKLFEQIEKMDAIYKFNLQDSIDYKKMLQKQIDGRIDSWAIRWYASVFIEGGLGLFPNKSLIKNIGHDGSGIHCTQKNIYDVDISNTQLPKFPGEIRESESGLEAMSQFYISNKEPIYQKILRFINIVLRR